MTKLRRYTTEQARALEDRLIAGGFGGTHQRKQLAVGVTRKTYEQTDHAANGRKGGRYVRPKGLTKKTLANLQQMHEYIQTHPFCETATLCEATGQSQQMVNKNANRLAKAGLVDIVTGKAGGRGRGRKNQYVATNRGWSVTLFDAAVQ